MKKIYIAGPITGVKGYRDRFKRAEQIIQETGYEPVSPVMPEDEEGSESYRFYIDHGLDLLKGCDAICLLPGWSVSRGALLERKYAITVKIPVYLIDSRYRRVIGPIR